LGQNTKASNAWCKSDKKWC